MKLGIGIIGVGVIAKYYLAALPESRSFELVGVCDRRDDALASFQGQGVRVYRDYRDLLNDPNIDAVIINLPNDLHAEACRHALEQGKHVCCEKPLTLNSREAKSLSDLARMCDLTLFTAFHRRYNTNVQSFLDELDPADSIVKITSHYYENIEDHAGNDTWYLVPERCGGGCLSDNGPNAFDTVRHVIGDLTVDSAVLHRDASGVDRRARIDMTSVSSIPVTVWLDWSYDRGEKKDLVVEFASGKQKTIDMLHGYPEFKSSLWHEYAAILDAFARSIEDGLHVGIDGVRIVELVEQAYRVADVEILGGICD